MSNVEPRVQSPDNSRWPEETVTGWSDFVRRVKEFCEPRPYPRYYYLFRGQSDAAWDLMPLLPRSWLRGRSDDDLRAAERDVLQEFRSQAHLHFSYVSEGTLSDPLVCWTLMQHHRAPTRLLDWTASAYVAAYFAVEDQRDAVGAVWMVEWRWVQDRLREHYDKHCDLVGRVMRDFTLDLSDPAVPARIWFDRPSFKADRMVAQDSWFSVCNQVSQDHASLIGAACSATQKRSPLLKLLIPSDKKREFADELLAMNISAHSLFPGPDGLGKGLAERIRSGRFFS